MKNFMIYEQVDFNFRFPIERVSYETRVLFRVMRWNHTFVHHIVNVAYRDHIVTQSHMTQFREFCLSPSIPSNYESEHFKLNNKHCIGGWDYT